MLIKEVISTLKLYGATVRVPSSASATASTTTIKTAIHAESAQHARQLLDHLYGANSVSSLILVTKFQTEATAGAGVGPLSADQLKLKALTARPAVRLATDTCLVVVLWTMGRTSVPARGVVLAGRALIFESAILLVPLLYDTRTELIAPSFSRRTWCCQAGAFISTSYVAKYMPVMITLASVLQAGG